MDRLARPRTPALAVGTSIAILALAPLSMSQVSPTLPAHPVSGIMPTQLLTEPIPDSPSAAQLRRGQYLVAAGDCMSCHLRDGGEPLAENTLRRDLLPQHHFRQRLWHRQLDR